jgi:catechol 2,3-dioxygenase-like lactoylglutathione lyase family enzyme
LASLVEPAANPDDPYAPERGRQLSAGLALPRIEHVNLTVSDPEATAALLETLFGWQERWRGPSQLGGWTIHVGTGSDYVALYTHGADSRFPKGRPFNHLGVEVPDLDAVEARVSAAGLIPFSHGDYEPGRRFYFLDPDGIEYEVVSYAAQG